MKFEELLSIVGDQPNHDPSSLFAGKPHAILQHPFTKGRDIYDLLWYLSNPDRPLPNFELLNNALIQTNWQGEVLTNSNWKRILFGKLESLQWVTVIEDVRPFLDGRFDISLLKLENFRKLLEI